MAVAPRLLAAVVFAKKHYKSARLWVSSVSCGLSAGLSADLSADLSAGFSASLLHSPALFLQQGHDGFQVLALHLDHPVPDGAAAAAGCPELFAKQRQRSGVKCQPPRITVMLLPPRPLVSHSYVAETVTSRRNAMHGKKRPVDSHARRMALKSPALM